jgi:hypothetical protein
MARLKVSPQASEVMKGGALCRSPGNRTERGVPKYEPATHTQPHAHGDADRHGE